MACAVSTEPVPPGPGAFDLDAAWQVAPQVQVRPERFGALLYHFGTRQLSFLKSPVLLTVVRSLAGQPSARAACRAAGCPGPGAGQLPPGPGHPGRVADDLPAGRGVTAAPAVARPPLPLVEQFQYGLAAPICLTWELTYACNLSCVHCLSSSGRRDPRELTTARVPGGHRRAAADAGLLRQHRRRRADRPAGLLGAARLRHRARRRRQVLHQRRQDHPGPVARQLAASDYVDVQISLDGATAEVNDAVRGPGSYDTALRAMRNLADAGFAGFKISVVMTRHNVGQLDAVQGDRRPVRRAAADHPAAPVRPRRRRVGRAAPDRGPAARAVRLAGRPRRAACSPATRSSTWPGTARRCPG